MNVVLYSIIGFHVPSLYERLWKFRRSAGTFWWDSWCRDWVKHGRYRAWNMKTQTVLQNLCSSCTVGHVNPTQYVHVRTCLCSDMPYHNSQMPDMHCQVGATSGTVLHIVNRDVMLPFLVSQQSDTTCWIYSAYCITSLDPPNIEVAQACNVWLQHQIANPGFIQSNSDVVEKYQEHG